MTVRIGVFPAAGGIGGSTVHNLLQSRSLSAHDLVFIARHPEKLADAAAAGVTIRQADYDNNLSLERAFEGIHVLFLISYASVEHQYRTEVANTLVQR